MSLLEYLLSLVLSVVNLALRLKTQVNGFARAPRAARSGGSIDCTDWPKMSHNWIKFRKSKPHKLTWLNISHLDAKCRYVSKCCSPVVCLHSKDDKAFVRTTPVHGKHPWPTPSGRQLVTSSAKDRHIIVQHLRNIAWLQQPGVRNRLRQNVQLIRSYRPYFGRILTKRQGATGAVVMYWRSVLFSDESSLNVRHVDGLESFQCRMDSSMGRTLDCKLEDPGAIPGCCSVLSL